MLIKSIELENFKQFKGKQKINFSTNYVNNVTIIHGENGSGKTTLLQAFLWCFYGIKGNDILLNKSLAISMGISDISNIRVSIEFQHEHNNYFITRNETIRKQLNDNVRVESTKFKVEYLSESGQYEEYNKESPKNFINRIFPQRLSCYFFFDGERIKNLGDNSRNGRNDLSKAVSNILGLDILVNARNHVNKVKRQFEKEQTSKNNDDNIKCIDDEIDRINNNIIIYKNEEEELENEKEELKGMIKESQYKLKTFRESKKLQLDRENFQEQKKIQNQRIEECRNRIFKLFSDKAYIFFAQQLFEKARNILSKYDVKDKCIEGLNGKAIDFVLNRGKCFCGKELKKGCPEYEMWLNMKEYLPPQSFGVMINNFIKDTKKNDISDFVNDINKGNKQFLREQGQLIKLEDKLCDITKLIDGINFDAIKKSEHDYRENKKRLDYIAENELSTIRAKKISSSDKLDKLKKRRKDFIEYNRKNTILDKRIEVCKILHDKFKDYYINREKIIRDILNQNVKKIFNNIIHKDYDIQIDNKYRFDVIDENGITVSMSEGEKQVTSLSFISGIIDIARDKQINQMLVKNSKYDSTEVYPLVMDSPFGSLDSRHRTRVADTIPKLSQQVIILVSSTQWKGEVEKELKDKIGKEYKLNYHKVNNNDISIEYTEIEEEGI